MLWFDYFHQMNFCGISVSCSVIYSTLFNIIIIHTSLQIVLVWIIAGLRRKNIRGVDECKQTFLEERTAVTSCMCQRGRAGVGHGTLCQPACFDDHTHTHTHTHTVSACSFSFWAWLRCEVTLNRKKLSKLNYRVFCLLLIKLLNLLVWLECLSLEHCSCQNADIFN